MRHFSTFAIALFFSSALVLASESTVVPVLPTNQHEFKSEVVLGDPNAPVIVVMYHSLSCLHCRDFKRDTFPEIKRRFIDTNKIAFIFRDMPTDERAMLAAKLAWCQKDPVTYLKTAELLLKNLPNSQGTAVIDWALAGQKEWYENLTSIAAQAGLSKDQVKACLEGNKDIEDSILGEAKKAMDIFDIQFAPTFLINGMKQDDIITVKHIEAALKVAAGHQSDQ